MDNAIKFVVDIQNADKVQQLTGYIGKQTEEIYRLNESLKQGAISQSQFQAQSVPFAQGVLNAAEQVKKLQPASAMSAQGLLQLGYAVDDVQYGFSAIVNNIPQIVMGLGGTAGVAGAVGIAVVAVNQLINHWGQLSDAMSSAWSGVAVEELAKIREGAETAAAAFEKLKKVPTEAQAGEAKGVSSAIVEAPTKAIVEGVKRSLEKERNTVGVYTDAERSKLGAMDADLAKYPGLKDWQKSERKKIEDAATARIVGGASVPGPAGDEARTTLARMAALQPGNFPKGFVKEIEESTPEGKRAIEQKRLDLAGGRLAREDEDKKKDANKKLVRELNAAGQENQRFGENRAQRDRIADLEKKRDFAQENREEGAKAVHDAAKDANKAQILQGPKAVTDMYQKAASGKQMTDLQKRANELLQKLDDELRDIKQELKKQQRVRPAE